VASRATAPVGAEPAAIEPSTLDSAAERWSPAPLIGWRRRALVAAALLGCLGLFLMARWLAGTPHLDAQWATNAQGALVLQASPLPELKSHVGQTLVAVSDANGQPQRVDALLLHRSPRWQVRDNARAAQIAQHELMASRLAAGSVELWFEGGARARAPAQARGLAGLGVLLWPLAGLGLLLYLFAVVVALARPHARNLLFALMALCQTGNLLIIAIETTRGLGLPVGAAALDFSVRLALDACTGAAMVHVFALHPKRLPRAGSMAAATWAVVALVVLLIDRELLAPAWWWAQGLCLTLGLVALGLIRHSYRAEPNPFAVVMQRLGLVTLATLVLTSAAVATSARLPVVAHGVAVGASVTWYLFLASLMLLTPFLARSRQVLREFALLAGVSTVAASIDLLFVTVFSLGAFTSLAVAVFVALALYAGARQFALQMMLGRNLLTTERTFELLYRAARDVQAQPQRYPQRLAQLLRELFEPLELQRVDRVPVQSRVVGGGSALVVPVRGQDDTQSAAAAVRLRFAQGGQRLFTRDDARLADRVVEQLRRAMAYDQAVERGRHEERQRLAQDLHDDIGARLLTLMYQAQSTEMEDYIRHTLQDLKTLTRGLAASDHRLSHAAAEWKTDLTQRLSAAQAQLGWHFSCDQDRPLTVVQWSALTRVLRELVSNALFHGHATRVEVVLQLEGPRLSLSVADDGQGRSPSAWSHGLGLGGVRKRVKVLGGHVTWRENQPSGIVCEVQVPDFHAPG
jgi:signal transduction histidine kinase